ncbi:MAG: hypothetical protein KIS61_09415 [Candidatus Eremiobacteraeota bacterium]|nr:hypothetical protein [Candidatus Eremiobacteraeota bacterium]
MPGEKIEAEISLNAKGVEAAAAGAAASLGKLDAAALETDNNIRKGLQSSLQSLGGIARTVNFNTLAGQLKAFNVNPQDTASLNAFGSALKGVQQTIQSNAGITQGLAGGFAGVSAVLAGSAAGAALLAGQFEQLQARLESATHSSATAFERFEQAKDVAANSPFDLKGEVQSAGQLEAFKLNSEELLPVVNKLAAGMGSDLPTATLAFAKAAAGSAEGFNSLRDLYGVTTKELLKFGAAEGKVQGTLDHGEENIERNRNALVRLINTNFGDAMERQSRTLQGAMSNVQDSAEVAVAGFGKALIPLATTGARVISGLLGAVDAIPEPLKAIGAGAAVAVAGVAGLGAVAGGGLAALLLLQGQLAGVVTGMAELGAASPVAAAALTRVTGVLGGAQAAMTRSNLAAAGLRLGFLGLAAVVAVVGTAMIDSWQKAEERVGDAVTGTSRKIAESNQFFRQGIAALNSAGQEAGVTVKILGNAGKQMDELNNAFAKLPANEVVRALLGVGLTAEDLKTKLKETAEGANDLRTKLLLLQAARQAYTRPGGIDAGELVDFQKRVKDAGITDSIATLEDLDTAIGKASRQYQRFGQDQLIAQKGLEAFDSILKPLVEATQKSAQLGHFLDLTKQVGTAYALAQGLESVNKQIQVNSKLPGIGSTDASTLIGKLADPSINEPGRAPEKAGIEAQLVLLRQREDLNKQIIQDAQRAAQEEVEAAELAFRRLKALGETNLHDELRFIEERLKAAKKGTEEEVKLLERRASVQQQIKKKLADLEKADFQKQFDKTQQNGNTSESQKIAELNRLKKVYVANADIQKTLATAVYQHEKTLTNNRIKDAKALAALRAQLEQDEINRSQARQGDLQRLSRRGVDTKAAEEVEIRKQGEARKKEIDDNLAKELADKKLSPELRKGLTRRANSQKQDVDSDVQRQLQDLGDRTSLESGARNAGLLQREEQVADFRVELLKEQASKGVDVQRQLLEAIKARLALQEKEIKQQAELRKAQTDDPREAALAEQEAQAAILRARRAANDELKSGLDLMKQGKAAKGGDPGEFSGRQQTIDEFIEGERKRFEFKSPTQKSPSLIPGIGIGEAEKAYLNQRAQSPLPSYDGSDSKAKPVIINGKIEVEIVGPEKDKYKIRTKEVTLDGRGSNLERSSRSLSGSNGLGG